MSNSDGQAYLHSIRGEDMEELEFNDYSTERTGGEVYDFITNKMPNLKTLISRICSLLKCRNKQSELVNMRGQGQGLVDVGIGP